MRVAVLFLATIVASGCSIDRCKHGTVLLSVSLTNGAESANFIDVQLSVDGGSPQNRTIAHTPGSTLGTIEVDFATYPSEQSLTFTLTARLDSQTLAAVSQTTPVTAGCTNVSLNLDRGTNGTIGDMAFNDLANDLGTGTLLDMLGCPSAWTVAPSVDPSIAVPDGGGVVLLHASATGTQNYACMLVSGSYVWVFQGPNANLADCNAQNIGKHFASDNGAAYPEWATTADSSYVVATKLASNSPSGAIPWLLYQSTSTAGGGPLSKTTYVQRVNTTGGLPPNTTCDSSAVGTSQQVTFTADFYFFGH